jgi:glycine oxidase
MKISMRSAVVVGGGVIGLTTAFRLANAGWPVTLFDPLPGKGATWAAAGMIAPSAEIAPGEEANYQLQNGALSAWRALSDDLHNVTSERIKLYETGTLLVGWDASDRRQVGQFAQVAQQFGVQPTRVCREDSPKMFEGVSGRIVEGLFIEGDAWLDPDQAISSIVQANAQLGVDVVHAKVIGVRSGEDGVTVTTAQGSMKATLGIIATGAEGLPVGAKGSGMNSVRPVRGMTARVGGVDRSAQPTLRAFVHGHVFYMVSRPGGYCVLGATSEERSEAVVEIGELQRLLRDALDVVPTLETANLIETRMGLRPASNDLEPFFEVLDGGRWAWSSGHYRHGVTVAPLAALDALAFAEGVK